MVEIDQNKSAALIWNINQPAYSVMNTRTGDLYLVWPEELTLWILFILFFIVKQNIYSIKCSIPVI